MKKKKKAQEVETERKKIQGKKKTSSLFAACFLLASSLSISFFFSPFLTAEMQHLVLDRDVRDWVLVPLTLCIALMMLMRQYATVSLMDFFSDPINRCFDEIDWRTLFPLSPLSFLSFRAPSSCLWHLTF